MQMDIHIPKKKRNTERNEKIKASNELKRLPHAGRYKNTKHKRMGKYRWPKMAQNYKFTKRRFYKKNKKIKKGFFRLAQ